MLYLCLLFIKVTVSSQESEWSCICVLGLSMLYLCLLFIEVTVPSQESEWSCMLLSGPLLVDEHVAMESVAGESFITWC